MLATLHSRFVVGVLGNVASLSVSLAPIPTFWKICRRRSTEDFSALPYAFSFFSNLLWGWYSLPIISAHNLPVLTISSIQASLRLVYLILYIVFAPPKQKAHVCLLLGVLVVIVGVVAAMTLAIFQGAHQRTFAGTAASIATVCSLAAPLSIMRLVVKTKSVEYMPLQLSVSLMLNCTMWTTYGILGQDLFLLVANGLGCLLVVAQLTLYAVYYNPMQTTPAEKITPSSSIEMEEQPCTI